MSWAPSFGFSQFSRHAKHANSPRKTGIESWQNSNRLQEQLPCIFVTLTSHGLVDIYIEFGGNLNNRNSTKESEESADWKLISLRASSPIWASEANLARTRERGAEERHRSLARSRETRFTRPHRKACSQGRNWSDGFTMKFRFFFHIFYSYFGRVLTQRSLENSGKKFSKMHVSKSPVKTPWPLLAPSYETYEILEVLDKRSETVIRLLISVNEVKKRKVGFSVTKKAKLQNSGRNNFNIIEYFVRIARIRFPVLDFISDVKWGYVTESHRHQTKKPLSE